MLLSLCAALALVSAFAILLVRKSKVRDTEALSKAADKPVFNAAYQRQIFPAISSQPHPCGHGSNPPISLAMGVSIASDPEAMMVWDVILDGDTVHHAFGSPLQASYRTKLLTVADIEEIASRSPHQEWLLRFIEPLRTLVYQRHGADQWNLVRIGTGMF